MKKINIAIDGHSSCGKSTTSKNLAKKLEYKYVDTGAMYRAVTLYFMNHSVNVSDEECVKRALSEIKLDFLVDEKGNRTLLNGKDVEAEIRTMEVSNMVSEVSTISIVRKKLVEFQQEIADSKGVVMDGRDIGSIVLPVAELKVFMTASVEARGNRRWLELKERGMHISVEDVKANLEHRDHIDSSRADSPLVQAEDALLLDTSDMTLEEQTNWIYDKVKGLISNI
ncbi:MAG: (d)CMP kinase [Bacteroidetes bacterium]|nr:(d)CMP kinase [Bacteroidota bacterium]